MKKITLLLALAAFAVGFGQQTEHLMGIAPKNHQQNSKIDSQQIIQFSADGLQGFDSKASHTAGVTEKPVFRSASSMGLPMINNVSMGGECLNWINPTSTTGWVDFNTQYGGAPTEAQGCPFNEINLFEVWASEAYSVDNFVAGVEYTFSMCNGPGAGSWVPDFTIIAPGGIVDAFGAGDGDGCSITWTASATGTYLIVINEEGFCGGGTNTATDNGFPALTCTGGGGGGSFPAPYCGPIVFTSDVEPITLVEVAGISNVSSAVINGSPAHEDFTAIVGEVDPGESYTIALEGNTGGNFTTSFTVFIDWDQNESLDDAGERYEIGSITNSNGTDGQQATGTITVPAGATLGDTRMRVIKRFTAAYATSSCIPGSGFGQAEDYTINVGGTGGGTPATDFTLLEVFPAASPFPLGTSPIAGPFAFSPIGPGITQQLFAGDYDDNDVLYGLNFTNNQLISIDSSTGVSTVIGPLTNLLAAHTVTGLSFNPVNGIMYASSTDGVITQIYTVDLTSGALTLVGSGTGNTLGIWLEIDNDGNAFMADVGTDSLYSVNLVTGTSSIIGSLGIDISFAQDATIDPSDNTLYMAAYLANSTSGIYTVNLTTGLATFSHDTAGKEFGVIAIPGSGSGGGGGNNWECADAIALTCGDVVTGSTTGATNSGGNASPDVFYEYTGSGQLEFVTISLCDGGTNYDSYLRVFASCGNLAVGSEIIFNDDFCGLQSQLTFESDGTSTYIIMVEGFGTGSGDFSLEITCELPAPPPACGGIFTDTGGVDGDYSNNEDEVWTITPDAGDAVTVIFTAFDVEANWDALYVFDGPDTSSPLISSGNPPTNTGFPAGGYWGTSIPGPFTSTHSTGALTFRFLSDGSVTRPGWIADVVCLPVPPPNDLIVNAIDVDQFTQAYTDPEVRLQFATNELLNPDGCAIAGTNGVWYKFTATADGTAEASVTTPAGTTAVIFYAAPDEDVTNETELVYTFESNNQCAPGTQASITTTAGQSYYIFVLNTGGESDVVIDISNSLGTNENTIDGFVFYPNPMENVLHLRSNTSIDNVTIYTILGQKVMDQNIGATSAEIQTSNLSTGAYLMKVVSEGQTATYRLIKR